VQVSTCQYGTWFAVFEVILTVLPQLVPDFAKDVRPMPLELATRKVVRSSRCWENAILQSSRLGVGRV
jgi:hypothetical protein